MLNTSNLKFRVKNRLFIFVVLIPVLLSILYYGFLASDVYISESKFVIRSPEKPAASGLGVILQSAGFANAGDEGFAAQTYASSRDALRAVNRNDAFEQAYTRPEISIFDRFNPFESSGSFEDLYKYFVKKVRLQNDSTTSITTLSVRAYTAEDARRFNERLLQLSEATVNRLNQRGRQDLIRYADNEVSKAKAQSLSAAMALAAFRNRTGVVDPEQQATVRMQMVAKLQDGLIAATTELAQLKRYTPENPRIPVVQTLLGTLQTEIDRELGKVAGNRGSLAANAVQFQRLTLENEFAGKQLGAALSSYEQARNEAQRQQAYVERIVEPNLADSPMEPRRLRGILATLALALVAFAILRMLLAGVKEHGQ